MNDNDNTTDVDICFAFESSNFMFFVCSRNQVFKISNGPEHICFKED